MLNELNSGGKLCDLMIGDSQWIGGAAENGQYIKLNDFFAQEGITMDAFLPADGGGLFRMAEEFAELLGPAGLCRRCRLDLSQGLVRTSGTAGRVQGKVRRALDVPKTLEELVDIAKFFQGREIDGKTVYGAAIYTERGSEGITMGVTNWLYNYGFEYGDPANPYELEGFVNSDGARQGPGSLQGPVMRTARLRARLTGT